MTERSKRRPADALSTAQARRLALTVFVIVVAFFGGGARADITSLVILRPLSFLFIAYAILVMPRGAAESVRPLLLLLGAAAVLICVQLIPLPHGIWSELPKRDIIARVDDLLGFGERWRPLALSPAGAWNALFSLAVPAAGLTLFCAQDARRAQLVYVLWLAFALFSAALGLLQLLMGPENALYFYRVTNGDQPVGLFSNVNHQAYFLLASMPVAALFLASQDLKRQGWKFFFTVIALFVFLAVVLLSQSRAAAIMTVPTFAISVWYAIRQRFSGRTIPLPSSLATFLRKTSARRAAVLFPVMAMASFVMLLAVNSIAQTSSAEELRVLALPTILTMVKDQVVVGAGAGSFDEAFKIYEPDNLISQYYLNQAHNDWLQVPIEFGIPGVLFLLAAILIAVSAWNRNNARLHLDLFGKVTTALPLAVMMLASFVDYPLRTPSIQLFVILWVAMLFQGLAGPRPRNGRSAA